MKISGKAISHFHWFDLLRFMAAFTVVVVHARGTTFVEYGGLVQSDKTLVVTLFFALTRIANEAVIIFFVLSGFLVGGRALYRMKEGQFRPTEYAIDRFVRILLPLVPALILTAVVRVIIDGEFDSVELVGNLLFLQGIFTSQFGGNAPLWSLSYEVWFYVLAFAVGILVKHDRLQFPPVVLIILVLCIFTALNSTYLFCWLIGAIAYEYMPTNFSRGIVYVSFCILIFSVAAIQIGYDSVSVSVQYLRSFLPSLDASRILLSLSIALLVQQLVFVGPSVGFARRIDDIGTVLASSSYTLYLTHYPILQLMSYLGLERSDEITPTSIAIFVSAISICMAVSWGMYLLFERHTVPARQILKKLVLAPR